jgi:hypothetical protein
MDENLLTVSNFSLWREAFTSLPEVGFYNIKIDGAGAPVL